MGLPLGWTILSMLHIYIVNRVLVELRVKRKHVLVLILGDDLVGYWPRKCDALYNKLILSHGLVISEDKHMVCSKYGNFARTNLVADIEYVVPLKYEFIDKRQEAAGPKVKKFIGLKVSQCFPIGMYSRSKKDNFEL